MSFNKLFPMVISVSAIFFLSCGGEGKSGENALPNSAKIEVTSVNLNNTSLSLDLGASFSLVPIIYPDHATNKTVTWTSSNESVAKVAVNGLVTAISEGSATISATTNDGNKVATCDLSVERFITVSYDELDSWLAHSALSERVNYVKVLEVPSHALLGNSYSRESGELGKKIKTGGKKLFLKIASIQGDYNSIGEYAFYLVRNLVGLDLLDCTNITTIGDYAFFSCSDLITVDLPHGLRTLGNHVFRSCTGLEHIDLPETITTIGKHVFINCSSLAKIDLPAGISSLGSRVFSYCSILDSINIPDSNEFFFFSWGSFI